MAGKIIFLSSSRKEVPYLWNPNLGSEITRKGKLFVFTLIEEEITRESTGIY